MSGGVPVWLCVWSEVLTCIWPSWCHCYSLSLASLKSRLVLLFWYWLTRVVPEKGPSNVCECVCVSKFGWLVGGRRLLGFHNTPYVTGRLVNIRTEVLPRATLAVAKQIIRNSSQCCMRRHSPLYYRLNSTTTLWVKKNKTPNSCP